MEYSKHNNYKILIIIIYEKSIKKKQKERTVELLVRKAGWL